MVNVMQFLRLTLARTYYHEPEDLKVYSVWQILSPDFNDVLILEDDDVSDCYWRPMFNLPTSFLC